MDNTEYVPALVDFVFSGELKGSSLVTNYNLTVRIKIRKYKYQALGNDYYKKYWLVGSK